MATRPEERALLAEWSSEPNLDLLRACAVLCVVSRHLLGLFQVRPTWWLQPQALGIFGVLIFFVHTSLVLMMSLDRQRRAGPISSVRVYTSFLVRRFFRIYPLSVVAVLIIYFAVIPFTNPSAETSDIAVRADTGDLLANLALVQDLVGRVSILAPLWSLPAEVQMYLVLPLLYSAARRWGARAIGLAIWPLSVMLAVAGWKLHLPVTGVRFAPCFVAGVLCYCLLRSRRVLPFWMFPVAIAIGLAAYMVLYGRLGMQAGLGIFVTLLLALSIPLFRRMDSSGLARASHVVAKYSYGIYLFHVPCLWLAFLKLKLPAVAALFCFVLLTAGASAVFFHALEDPLIRLGQVLSARIARGEARVAAPLAPAT